MAKRMIIMLVLVAAVGGGVWFMHGFSAAFVQKLVARMQSQPQTVSATTAREQDWTAQLQAVGSLRAVRGADLSLQVGGVVAEIDFKSGQQVEKGKRLLALDDSAETAQLKALKAAAHLAAVTYERDKRQYQARAISKQVLDNDRATLSQARANVARQQAVVNRKHLMAPFPGRLGLRQVDLGQYLDPGTPVVTLQSLSPIYVDFYLPQQALADIAPGQHVSLSNDTWPGEVFTGAITAISPKVDTSTRNVQVRAQLDNPDAKLRPGMYATVKITTGKPAPFITLPQTAINYHPYGDTVFIITSESGQEPVADTRADTPAANGSTRNASGNGKQAGETLVVHQQFVTVGKTRGDQVQLLKGVKVGDRVVTSGQMKLRNGSHVTINNTLQPLDAPHPTPQEGA